MPTSWHCLYEGNGTDEELKRLKSRATEGGRTIVKGQGYVGSLLNKRALLHAGVGTTQGGGECGERERDAGEVKVNVTECHHHPH